MRLKQLRQSLLRLVPDSDRVDRAIAFAEFVRFHRRLPKKVHLFNDFLYQLKSTDRILDPLRVFVSDKEFVKTYVKAVVGDQYNVPTIAIISSVVEAADYAYPTECCIKPTHLSGEVILRLDGSAVDYRKINRWFSASHYRTTRERNYRTLKPKVIVEPIVFGDPNPTDYKIFCYEGRAKMVQLDLDRRIDHRRKFFDREWNELPFTLGFPRSSTVVERPANLAEMLDVAEALSERFDLIRIDLYSNGKDCVVGEITNCHGNAGDRFTPASAEEAASRLLFGAECGAVSKGL